MPMNFNFKNIIISVPCQFQSGHLPKANFFRLYVHIHFSMDLLFALLDVQHKYLMMLGATKLRVCICEVLFQIEFLYWICYTS